MVDLTRLSRATPAIYPWVITEGNYAGRMGVYVPPLYMDRVKEIPGARYARSVGVWTLPKAWPAVLSLGEMKRQTGLPLRPEPSLQQWVTEQSKHWANLRALSAAMVPDAVKTPGDLFYPHQEDDAAWLAYGGGYEPVQGRLLLSETGIGKTAGTIAGILRLGLTGPILVCAPKRTLKKAWVDDLHTFAPHLRVEMIRGSATQRRKSIDKIAAGEADVGVIGWESMRGHTRFAPFPGHTLKRCIECGGPDPSKHVDEEGKPVVEVTAARCQAHAKELNAIDWQLIIGDEVHRVMNTSSQTTMALWGLVRYAPKALRWGLTGTPLSKQVEQIWSLLHYADSEAFPVKSSWTTYYAVSGYNYNGIFETQGLNPERAPEFQQVFSALSRRRLKAEVLKQLPPLQMGGGLVREVDMAPEQKKVYVAMRDEMIAKVEEGLIVASNALVNAGKLTMLANATGYPDPNFEPDPDPEKHKEPPTLLRAPSGKIAAVIEDMLSGEFDGKQVAVSFESRRLLRLTHDAMTDAGIDPDNIGVIAGDVTDFESERDIGEFQSGKRQWMLYTYAAGGTGLTLTAASYLMRVQRSWSPILSKQGLDRVHRIGSEIHESVSVIDYITTGTIEETQMERAAEDAELLESVVQDKDRLKALFGGS